MYAPDEDDEDNKYDHDDEMSEDDVLGGSHASEEETARIDISSGEDEARVKGKKKKGRKQMSPRIQRLGNILRRCSLLMKKTPMDLRC
jgi:hypothetical protein